MNDDDDDTEHRTVLLRQTLLARDEIYDPAKDQTYVGLLTCLDPELVDDAGDGRYWIPTSEAVVGRGGDSSVRITSSDVSREHARFRAFNEKWIVEDLGSRNGVWINGEPLSGQGALGTGDTVGLGRVRFRFEILRMSPSEVPSPGAATETRASQEDTGSMSAVVTSAPPPHTAQAPAPDDSHDDTIGLEPAEEVAAILRPHQGPVLEVLIERARAGDVDAIRLFLDYALPRR